MGLQQQLPLRISGITKTGLLNTSEVSTQVRCLAQLRPIIGVVKPGCRMSTWKRPLLPRGKLSRPGRLVKALEHHTMQPNAFLDMHCMRRPTGDQEVAETRRSRVQPQPRSATFLRGDWSWNIFYGHSLPSADSRRAVVSFWRKNVHNTG